ncbi:50S ribosomal protein L25/general stress protein Ctc [Herbiconiux sp. L3-i23]|uniref:50S ribosomal protein L25/general stress protein Ctc n=1 Tax=Herbiconiux sp. L3-i23 TaxID=2905871 RepID=UPI0020601096|nr:50S ribosomal protein L25/general stress protein Ctc [Herbiconiux sp. L3-i23]BDI23612.1 50S ribosomal protein L25 [Herbiconiux sp. L3-i23]
MADKITAELRESFGKGAARKIRAANKIPAVIYGHGTEPQHVTLPGHEVALILRRANAVLDLDIAGKSQLVLVKDVQKDPVRQIIEHIDLVIIRRGEKVAVEVPVHVEGEPAAGTIANLDATTISLLVEATHIPQSVVVSVEGLEEGAQITAADVTLPEGAALASDPELLIVGVMTTPAEESEEAEEAAEGETPAEAEAEATDESAE